VLEYERAAGSFSHVHRLRRSAQLLVARSDLADAACLEPELEHLPEFHESLRLLAENAEKLRGDLLTFEGSAAGSSSESAASAGF
jgi:hypothetical protein